MAPALIMWLYVSGGIGFYALAPGHERASHMFVFMIVCWPVAITWRILLGLLDGIRGAIGK